MATLYGAKGGSSNSDLYTIDPVTGVWTSVGPIGRAVTGLAFDPGSGILYGSTSAQSPSNPKSLITVNPVTGAGTLVGSYGLAGGRTMADIAFKSDGTLYGSGNDGHLYTINKATGVPTHIGITGAGSVGVGFEIDAADNGYIFGNGSDNGEPFYLIDLATGAGIEIGTIQNGDDFPFSGDAISAASFDDSGVMWVVLNNFGSAIDNGVATIDSTGTFLAAVGTGLTQNDALAWQGSVKPNPWFAGFPDLFENFDEAPLVPAADSCSTPLGALVSSDGAAAGPSSLKIDPSGNLDSYVVFATPEDPINTQWVYTSFALYVPSWASFWDGGNAWDPAVVSLDDTPFGSWAWWLQPDSPTTGALEDNAGNLYPIPDGQWVAVELAYVADDGSSFPKGATQAWINNVDQGLIVDVSSLSPQAFVTLGDTAWNVAPVDISFYIDEFTWSVNGRIGPVDLSGAFFNGAGSGTQLDACTGLPVTPHPVDDSYTTAENHTLNVPAPGVMINDISPTTVSLNTGPANGSLILNTDGSFSYTPNPGFIGVDTWVYNGNGGTATVTITVVFQEPTAIFDSAPGFKTAA